MFHSIFGSALVSLMFALALLNSDTAHAQAQRTFVKSTGSDTNACSLASPCRGFASALAQTAANGEIIVLDSAGYGAVTINKSVSIIAPQGIYAGISVFSGTGIEITGTNVKVVLKGLSINGQGGSNGITITGTGTLHIENCTVSNIAGIGLYFNPSGAAGLYVKDSVFRNSATAQIAVLGSATKGSIVNTRVEDGALGGIVTGDSAVVSVRHSVASGNSFGFSVSGASTLSVEDSVASNNGYGIYSQETAKVTAARNTVTGNVYGLYQIGGVFESLGNNTVRNNTFNTSGTITTIGGS